LRHELDRPAWTRENVAFGTATDPYQPIEGHYRLTRRSIEVDQDESADRRVLNGLRSGDRVVTGGALLLREEEVKRAS